MRSPPPELGRMISHGLGPFRALARPHFEGLERIPQVRPLLFVGNHTLGGALDVPFLVAELYERRGIFLRALGDHLHFVMPVWRTVMRRYGVVEGTPDNLRRLFAEGEAVLVFPGGGREMSKRKGEQYRLLWKERLGFARLAVEQGVTIVPFASVGVEHALDVVADAEELLRTPVGKLLRALHPRAHEVPPVVKGIGPTPIPRPERLYFHFAEPVDTAPVRGRHEDLAVVRAVRDEVQAKVEAGIAALLAFREVDPHRGVWTRIHASVAERLARAQGGAIDKASVQRS